MLPSAACLTPSSWVLKGIYPSGHGSCKGPSPYTVTPRFVNQCHNEFSGEECFRTLMQLETASDSDSSPSSTESTV